jgi:hypothetical protein
MKIKQDFRIGDNNVKFYSYWGKVHPVKVNGKECYAVTWQNGNSYLVVVANLSREGQDLTVTLNKEFFGKSSEVVDAESKEAVKLNNGSFSITIPRRNYKIFTIRK